MKEHLYQNTIKVDKENWVLGSLLTTVIEHKIYEMYQ